MLSRKRLLLALLAVTAAALACWVIDYSASTARQRERLAEVQEKISAQMAQQEELRKSLQKLREGRGRTEPLPRTLPGHDRKQGDFWRPGELDRLCPNPLFPVHGV